MKRLRPRTKIGPFPAWLWGVVALAGYWYLRQRGQGRIEPTRKPLLLEAFDQPRERADLVRGVVIGLVSGIVSYYLLTKTRALR